MQLVGADDEDRVLDGIEPVDGAVHAPGEKLVEYATFVAAVLDQLGEILPIGTPHVLAGAELNHEVLPGLRIE
jgi:hypothetical protein